MASISKGSAKVPAIWAIVRGYPRDAPGAISAAAAGLPVLLLASMGYAQRWVTEDAFIDFRIVRHLLAGHGPVFNIGERVEAYTSPLWVALLAVCGALGAATEVSSVVLGLVLSVAGLLLAQAGAWMLGSRLLGGASGASGRPADGRLALPLGAAVFAVVPIAWDFTTSGLESGLVIGWLGGVFWLLARSRPVTMRNARLAAFAIGCGPLVRPDLALFSVGFGAALWVIGSCSSEHRLTGPEWARLGIVATALPLSYQVFRMGYFAALVPNTALAKEASAAYWAQGWRYAVDFAGTYHLWLPLMLVGAWAAALLRSARRPRDLPTAVLLLAPMFSALLHGMYVTRVGGDFMHGRLLLPSLFGFLLPLATVVVAVPAFRGWRVAALACVTTWAVVCALWLRVPYLGTIGPSAIADERGVWAQGMNVPNPIRLYYSHHMHIVQQFREGLDHDRAIVFARPEGPAFAAFLAPSVPRSIRVVLGLENIGRFGYLAGSDVHVVDRFGLADPIASRLLLTKRDRPGHEKLLPTVWVVARFGDPGAAAARFPSVREAAAALRCGELARLLHAVSDSLTLSTFLANARDAWIFHRLRIPADPAAAAERFCEPQLTRR